ncbi:unnamed protein product, partial [Brenthis ino]
MFLPNNNILTNTSTYHSRNRKRRRSRRPREEQADPAATGAAAARAQVPALREPVQRRDVAVHAPALQDHEERTQSYDVMSEKPRRYKKGSTIKKKRTPVNSESLKKAVACVINENSSLKGAAKLYGLNVMTLKRYVRAKKANLTCSDISYTSDYTKRKVFNDTEEDSLKKYLVKASKLHHELTGKQIRQLAFRFSTTINKKVPQSWTKNEAAGIEWLHGFMRRNIGLKLCSSQDQVSCRRTNRKRN